MRLPTRHLAFVVLALTLPSVLGCATPSWPIEPGDPVELAEDEGILVVHVRTNSEINSMFIGANKAAEDLAPGEHLTLIGAKEGWYRWAEIYVPNTSGRSLYRNRYRAIGEGEPVSFPFRPKDFLEFQVEAGKINYVGMVDVYRESWRSMWMGTLDRSAAALRLLEQEFPRITAKYPVVYSGDAENGYLENYLRIRDELAARESR
jgi:hypothetical protein